jgi:hypothetical protein
MSAEDGNASAALAAIRTYLEAHTLAEFIGENHHQLDTLRKGKSTISDAMAVRGGDLAVQHLAAPRDRAGQGTAMAGWL